MSAFLQWQRYLTTYRSKGSQIPRTLFRVLSLIYSFYKSNQPFVHLNPLERGVRVALQRRKKFSV